MYYIYAHINPIKNEVFYIGKGKGDRLTCKYRRNKFWNNTVTKYGIKHHILAKCESESEAYRIEKSLIKMFGRREDGGSLVNFAEGGKGGNTGVKPFLGKHHTTESKRRIGEARLGKKLSDVVKEKVIAGSVKGRAKSLEVRTHCVECLLSGKVWRNRTECINELGLTINGFKSRIHRDCPIKGNHLRLIKIKN